MWLNFTSNTAKTNIGITSITKCISSNLSCDAPDFSLWVVHNFLTLVRKISRLFFSFNLDSVQESSILDEEKQILIATKMFTFLCHQNLKSFEVLKTPRILAFEFLGAFKILNLRRILMTRHAIHFMVLDNYTILQPTHFKGASLFLNISLYI